MDDNKAKSVIASAGCAVAAFAAAVVLHPLIVPALVGGGAYVGYKAVRNKKDGGPKN